MGFEPVTPANTGAMLYQLSCEATKKIGSQVIFCRFYLLQIIIRGGHGFEPAEALIFFRFIFLNCINW